MVHLTTTHSLEPLNSSLPEKSCRNGNAKQFKFYTLTLISFQRWKKASLPLGSQAAQAVQQGSQFIVRLAKSLNVPPPSLHGIPKTSDNYFFVDLTSLPHIKILDVLVVAIHLF